MDQEDPLHTIFLLKKENLMNRILNLENLQSIILEILEKLQRPLSQKKLRRFITELFEYENTVDEIDFAIKTLINKQLIVKKNQHIILSELADPWTGTLTPADEGIACYLLSLKETAKSDIYFSPFCSIPLSCKLFFKFVEMNFPWMLGNESALALLEYITSRSGYKNIALLYNEMNDYPGNGWFTQFFNSNNCHLLVSQFQSKKGVVVFNLILLPDKKKDYSKSRNQLQEFKTNIEKYFESYKIIINNKNLNMLTSKIFE